MWISLTLTVQKRMEFAHLPYIYIEKFFKETILYIFLSFLQSSPLILFRDVPDSDLVGYWMSGKSKHGLILDIWPLTNARYRISGHFQMLDIWPDTPFLKYWISAHKLPDIWS